MIELKLATSKDTKDWDDLVEKASFSTIFHKWEWLKIVEKYTNGKLYPVIAYRGDTPAGVYPLFYSKKNFIKMVFSPPPRTLLLYLGPIFTDFESLKQSKRESLLIETQERINEFIMGFKPNYIRIRTVPGLIDSRHFKWTGYEVEPLYTYMVDLSGGIENVWKGLRKELRRNINKAQVEGVTIEEGFIEDLHYIDEALTRRFEEQGESRKSYKPYLSELYNSFHPHHLKIFVAKYKGERITGQIVVCHKDRVSLWAGSPKTSFLRGTPNDLLQWEIIKWACEEGYKRVEIMDAGDDPRLRHFKAKFNPELVPWYSAVKYSSFIFKGLEKLIRKFRS